VKAFALLLPIGLISALVQGDHAQGVDLKDTCAYAAIRIALDMVTQMAEGDTEEPESEFAEGCFIFILYIIF
jgi:hypothetical protein